MGRGNSREGGGDSPAERQLPAARAGADAPRRGAGQDSVCKLDEGMGKVVCKSDLFPDQGKNLVRCRRTAAAPPARQPPMRRVRLVRKEGRDVSS